MPPKTSQLLSVCGCWRKSNRWQSDILNWSKQRNFCDQILLHCTHAVDLRQISRSLRSPAEKYHNAKLTVLTRDISSVHWKKLTWVTRPGGDWSTHTCGNGEVVCSGKRISISFSLVSEVAHILVWIRENKWKPKPNNIHLLVSGSCTPCASQFVSSVTPEEKCQMVDLDVNV